MLQPEIRPFGSEHAIFSIQFDSLWFQVGRAKGFAGHLEMKNQSQSRAFVKGGS
jgi:hypothetical protein